MCSSRCSTAGRRDLAPQLELRRAECETLTARQPIAAECVDMLDRVRAALSDQGTSESDQGGGAARTSAEGSNA